MIEHLKDHLAWLQYAHVLWGFGLFVGLALWVYWPSRRRQLQDQAARILEDDTAPSDARGHHVAKY